MIMKIESLGLSVSANVQVCNQIIHNVYNQNIHIHVHVYNPRMNSDSFFTNISRLISYSPYFFLMV